MLKLKTETKNDSVTGFVKDATTEFYKAVEKHPLWPESLVYDVNEEHIRRSKNKIKDELTKNRMFNDREKGLLSTAETIFLEEWFEFLESAVVRRDPVAARHELAQCMAMLMRIGVHLGDYLPIRLEDCKENFRDGENVFLVRCPKCRRENHKSSVASGECAWCGWTEGDKDKQLVENSHESTTNYAQK